MENSRMKFKQKIGPIYEDASPVDFQYETSIGPQDSIDLLQSPLGSDQFTPNLAVIQELEEIRHMIEIKSRDLSKQEAILSQSIDQLHFDHARAVHALKAKADEMLHESVELLESRFEKGALKINNLLEKVDKRVKDLGTVEKTLAVVRARSADVPPLPDENSSSNSFMDDLARSCLVPQRIYRPPVERQFAYALLALISGQVQTKDFRHQIVAIILEYLMEGVESLLNGRFMTIADETVSEAPLVETRFDRAKRGVVVKRLGLGEPNRTTIDICLANVEPPMKFDAQYYVNDNRIRSSYNDAISRTSKSGATAPTCLLSALIDSGVASIIRQSFSQQKSISQEETRFEVHLIRVLVSSVKEVHDALRPFCITNMMEKAILVGVDWLRIAKIVVFVLDRVGGSLNEPTATQIGLIFDNLIAVANMRRFFEHLLNWKQGICWMIHFVAKRDLNDSENIVAIHILNLLDKVPSVSDLIHPWRNSLLHILQGDSVSDKCAIRIKMLLKINSYS